MSFQRTNRRSRRAGKFFLLAAPLLLVILAAIPLVGMSVGQAPPGGETVPGSSPGLALVNADRGVRGKDYLAFNPTGTAGRVSRGRGRSGRSAGRPSH